MVIEVVPVTPVSGNPSPNVHALGFSGSTTILSAIPGLSSSILSYSTAPIVLGASAKSAS